jgi:tetratricopeptide (TPR) repeat protein
MPWFCRSLILFFSCLSCSLAAQPDHQQLQSWLKSLSVKHDPRATNLESVYQAIIKLDTTNRCVAIQELQAQSQDANTRCKIRVRLLSHLMNFPGIPCVPVTDPIDNLRRALQLAYELEDEHLQFEIHLRLGQLYNGAYAYGLATIHFQQMFDILSRHDRADFYLPSGGYYDMGYSLYHTHQYDKSIRSGLLALRALRNVQTLPDDALNTYQKMLQWNTIGLAYHKINKPDSAFLAFENAASIAKELNHNFWSAIIDGNKGDVYYSLGKYDSANLLLQHDYDISLQERQYDNAANSLQWIARIDLQNGKPDVALAKLRTAKKLLQQMPQPNYLANVYYGFSQVFTSLGRADSVNTYLQKYLHLHDSLQAVVTSSRADILQMQIDNQSQVQTIKALNRQKKSIALTRNYTIAIVILLGLIGYLWLNRVRLKLQIRQREALEGRRIAESETKRAISQLDEFRLHLLEKNTLIEQLQSVQESKDTSSDQLKTLSDLTHHLILNEDDWLRFKELFDSVYPGFFISLRNTFPDITQAEQRMAALSKLKLTAREAANLLGVSPNTVYTTRRRLRQRLGLEQDADLDPYFNEEKG